MKKQYFILKNPKLQYILMIMPHIESNPFLGTDCKHFKSFSYGIKDIICDNIQQIPINMQKYDHESWISYESLILNGQDTNKKPFINILKSLKIPVYEKITLEILNIIPIGENTFLIDKAVLHKNA